MKCKFCGQESYLIEAHVIPVGFFRRIRQGSANLKMITNKAGEYTKKAPIGVYDSTIVCMNCEAIWQEHLINTQGGPRRNAKGQILQPNGSPIPRLYSAGELGSIYSFLYQGGGNIGECMAFGRISGRNAAAERHWG